MCIRPGGLALTVFGGQNRGHCYRPYVITLSVSYRCSLSVWPLLRNLDDQELRCLAAELPAVVLSSKVDATTRKVENMGSHEAGRSKLPRTGGTSGLVHAAPQQVYTLKGSS